MFTSPGMQSLMGQMRWLIFDFNCAFVEGILLRDSPTLMSQMMSAPYMQGIFRGLQDNPDQVDLALKWLC